MYALQHVPKHAPRQPVPTPAASSQTKNLGFGALSQGCLYPMSR